jgi:hypothetical protein
MCSTVAPAAIVCLRAERLKFPVADQVCGTHAVRHTHGTLVSRPHYLEIVHYQHNTIVICFNEKQASFPKRTRLTLLCFAIVPPHLAFFLHTVFCDSAPSPFMLPAIPCCILVPRPHLALCTQCSALVPLLTFHILCTFSCTLMPPHLASSLHSVLHFWCPLTCHPFKIRMLESVSTCQSTRLSFVLVFTCGNVSTLMHFHRSCMFHHPPRSGSVFLYVSHLGLIPKDSVESSLFVPLLCVCSCSHLTKNKLLSCANRYKHNK